MIFLILQRSQLVDNYYTLLNVSQVSVLLPLALGLIRFRHLASWQRIVFFLLITIVLTELLATYIKEYITPTNNLMAYNVYSIVLFVLMNRIYAQKLNWPIMPPTFNILLIVFILLSLANIFFIQPIDTYNTNTIVCSYAVFILMAITYFYQSLKSASDKAWNETPFFWFNTGVLIYYSAALILFLFVNQIIVSSQETIEKCWTLNAILYLLLNCFYSISLWKPNKKSITLAK